MGLNVVIMGPPGAGKGTQSDLLAGNRSLAKVATGDILREAIRQGTPLGLRAKALMDQGQLVDDATVIGIVRERLARPDAVGGFLLDGFPRTVAQAQALDGLIAERGLAPALPDDQESPANLDVGNDGSRHGRRRHRRREGVYRARRRAQCHPGHGQPPRDQAAASGIRPGHVPAA